MATEIQHPRARASIPLNPLLDMLVERNGFLEKLSDLVAERLPPTKLSPAPPQQEWFNTKAAAAYLGLRPNTLEILRSRGGGPKFYKTGNLVRYRRADLDEAASKDARRSTSEERKKTTGRRQR